MRTKLPAHITSINEAQSFLKSLYDNGESYHPEDDAKDCLPHITEEEGAKLNELMNEIYTLPVNEGYGKIHPPHLVFDPCEFLLDLDWTPKETLDYLLEDIQKHFPDLSTDPDSIQSDWLDRIKQALRNIEYNK